MPRKMERKRIWKEHELDWQYWKLSRIRDELDSLIDRMGPDAILDMEDGDEYTSARLYLGWEELESEEDFARRQEKAREQAKKERVQRREKELKELARLKKKYPDHNQED